MANFIPRPGKNRITGDFPMNTKRILTLAVACTLTLPGARAQDEDASPRVKAQVQKWMGEFSKGQFLKSIEERREACEAVVLQLKAKGLETDALKARYAETAKAYNAVLTGLSKDIAGITNIMDFATYSAREKFSFELMAARQTDAEFGTEAADALQRETSAAGELVKTVVSTLFPGAGALQEMTLTYLKRRLNARLVEARFRGWVEIK